MSDKTSNLRKMVRAILDEDYSKQVDNSFPPTNFDENTEKNEPVKVVDDKIIAEKENNDIINTK